MSFITNLTEVSIRYHPLHDTKPAILDSMLLIAGQLSLEDVRLAVEANQKVIEPELDDIISQCIRYCLEIYNALERERLWMALELLYRTRGLLMQLFTVTCGGIRTTHFFEAHASVDLQILLKQIVPAPTLKSATDALTNLIELLDNELDDFSHTQYHLRIPQRKILQQIKHHASYL